MEPADVPRGNRRVGHWLAAWLAGVLALDGGSASAELVHTTEYRTHPVHGTTPRAVWQYMNAHPIIDPDDGPAYANLTHDHDVAMKTARRAASAGSAISPFAGDSS